MSGLTYRTRRCDGTRTKTSVANRLLRGRRHCVTCPWHTRSVSSGEMQKSCDSDYNQVAKD